MKQVIVRIRDCRPTYIKTIAKAHFYSQAHYKSGVIDFVKDLMPGQDIYVKVGNYYQTFFSYAEIYEDAKTDNISFEEELYNKLIDSYLMTAVKEYLPRY